MKRFVLLVCAFLLALSAAPDLTLADTDPPPVLANILITEVKLGETKPTAKEPVRQFVTLFNTSDQVVDLSGWRLEYAKAAFGGTCDQAASWAEDKNGRETLFDGEVLAASGVLSIERSLNDNESGSLRVAQPAADETIIVHDLVGWGDTAPCMQGEAAALPAKGESLQRYLGCETALPVNTNNNSTDFFVAEEPSFNELAGAPLPICETEEPSEEENNEDEQPPPAPLTCEGVIITEVLPNAAGPDSGNEFIELYNPTTDIILLDGCGLAVGNDVYWFERGIELEPETYRAFYDDQTGLTLPNAAGGTVYLISPDEEELHEATYQPNLDDDVAWAWIEDDTWEATYSPTPNAANTSQPLKPCPEGQYRHAETNRCRSEVSSASTMLTPCGEGRERNPETNRCRNVAGNTRTLVPCDPGEERNPATNRCRKIASTSNLKPCDEGQERNPETNRCRKVANANTSAVPNVQDIQASHEGNTLRWWIVGAVVAGAAGYAIFEWRRDIAAWLRKYKQSSGK